MLVTGGTGGPVAPLARWLAEGGAEHIVLLDSSGPEGPAAAPLVAELTELGSEVTVADRDPADPADVEALVAWLARKEVRIGTVVHTSMSGELAPLAELTGGQLAAAVGADQAVAARHLAERCGLRPEDTVVYCASAAAVWGSRDHGVYCAANACLDALAQRRRADGGHAVSIAWGLWDLADGDGGADALPGADLERSRRQGLPPLDPGAALTALRRILDRGDPDTVVADVAWDTFAPLFELARASRLLDGVPAARRAAAEAHEHGADGTGDGAG
ncbi:KR domain-containing protein, partial [Streptomyces sp. SB3404]|nr:KR domain-containing protein [Streptomyces boncukensis]